MTEAEQRAHDNLGPVVRQWQTQKLSSSLQLLVIGAALCVGGILFGKWAIETDATVPGLRAILIGSILGGAVLALVGFLRTLISNRRIAVHERGVAEYKGANLAGEYPFATHRPVVNWTGSDGSLSMVESVRDGTTRILNADGSHLKEMIPLVTSMADEQQLEPDRATLAAGGSTHHFTVELTPTVLRHYGIKLTGENPLLAEIPLDTITGVSIVGADVHRALQIQHAAGQVLPIPTSLVGSPNVVVQLLRERMGGTGGQL